MLIRGRYLGVLAKVYSHATVEYNFAIERLLDQLRGFDIVENDDDATERFQRRPCVDCSMLIYECANGLEVIQLEDGGIVEILFTVRIQVPGLTPWK